MVAKGVKRATAPTKTCGEWEVQTNTTEKENPEEVGWIFELCGVRYGGEGSACKGASLGVKQGLAGWRDHGLELIGHGCVDRGGCLLLPSLGSGCVFFWVCVRWVGSVPLCQFLPVWGCPTMLLERLCSARCCLDARYCW